MKIRRFSAPRSYIVLMALSFFAILPPTFWAGSAAALQPIRSSGNNLPLHPEQETAPAGSVRFVRLHGELGEKKPGDVLQELETNFIQPLYNSGNQILFSYVAQAGVEGRFFLNLVLEPATADDAELFQDYVRARELVAFHGHAVHFERVMAIFEVASLRAGTRAEESKPLHSAFELHRNFAFMSLRSLKEFTNNYAFALRSKYQDFATYLEHFVADVAEFSLFRNDVLPKNTFVAIEPKPYLILEHGDSIGPASDESPFLPLTASRNCSSADHEGGACVSPVIRPDVVPGIVPDLRTDIRPVTDARGQ